jgi:hypothetical protein
MIEDSIPVRTGNFTDTACSWTARRGSLPLEAAKTGRSKCCEKSPGTCALLLEQRGFLEGRLTVKARIIGSINRFIFNRDEIYSSQTGKIVNKKKQRLEITDVTADGLHLQHPQTLSIRSPAKQLTPPFIAIH